MEGRPPPILEGRSVHGRVPRIGWWEHGCSMAKWRSSVVAFVVTGSLAIGPFALRGAPSDKRLELARCTITGMKTT